MTDGDIPFVEFVPNKKTYLLVEFLPSNKPLHQRTFIVQWSEKYSDFRLGATTCIPIPGSEGRWHMARVIGLGNEKAMNVLLKSTTQSSFPSKFAETFAGFFSGGKPPPPNYDYGGVVSEEYLIDQYMDNFNSRKSVYPDYFLAKIYGTSYHFAVHEKKYKLNDFRKIECSYKNGQLSVEFFYTPKTTYKV
jgi:hypothetical protein